MTDTAPRSANGLREIHAGFIPLIDCAPLVVAREMGFDAAQGLQLVLHKDVSWANIRDKAEADALDCAIMLAPMPLAATLGLGGRPAVAMTALMATSLNGNAITVSTSLYNEMRTADRASAEGGGMSAAKSVAAVVAQRRADGVEPLTFGMVYPFSCHNYDLRHWLASAGVDPDNDVNLIVVPPPLIAGSLKSGRIDGFCVGEPWNSVAVADGSGVIVATKAELWGASPEKVLAVRSDFAASSPDTVMALIRALHHACKWLDAPSHRKTAAEILAQPAYIGIDAGILQRALTDDLVRTEGYAGQHTTDVVVFNKGGANFPWVSHAVWHLTQMIRWGQVRRPFDIVDVARRVYRPDLFRAAVAEVNVTPPDVDAKPEGGGRFFGGESFDPNDPLDYLEHVALRDRSVDLASFETARRSEL